MSSMLPSTLVPHAGHAQWGLQAFDCVSCQRCFHFRKTAEAQVRANLNPCPPQPATHSWTYTTLSNSALPRGCILLAPEVSPEL